MVSISSRRVKVTYNAGAQANYQTLVDKHNSTTDSLTLSTMYRMLAESLNSKCTPLNLIHHWRYQWGLQKTMCRTDLTDCSVSSTLLSNMRINSI